MGVIAKPIGALLQLIYDFVGVYGVAIIILTVIVKCCLYPLYAMQTKSTASMTDIQPKVREIQKKYQNDQQMMNLKIQELYKEEKFNPMAGCLPMLIQFPIIMGLFVLLRDPLKFMGTNNDILFAVHDAFLWMTDLTQPDKWILPLAAGVATFISFTMTQALTAGNAAGGAAAQTNAMMKGMKYIFPVMIVWMARTYPAGLSIYWFVSQIIQIFINLRLNSIRKKIRADKENKKKRK